MFLWKLKKPAELTPIAPIENHREREKINRPNRTAIPFEKLVIKIKEFTACAPVTIQTMVCAVDGSGPPPEEAQAWET